MEKRVLLAVTLSFLTLTVYQLLFVKPRQQSARPPATTTAPAGRRHARCQRAGAGSPPPAADAARGRDAGRARRSRCRRRRARRRRGDGGDSRRVQHSRRRAPQLDPQGVFRRPQASDRPRAAPLPRRMRRGRSRSRSVIGALSARLNRALFRPSATRLEPQTGPRELTFEYEDASGLAVRKTFEFLPDGQPYVVAVTVDARNGKKRCRSRWRAVRVLVTPSARRAAAASSRPTTTRRPKASSISTAR